MSSGYAPFDDYHKQFRSHIRDINQLLPDETQDLAALLRQCEDLLVQMKVEAKSASGSSLKREWMDIHQACEQQLSSYQTIHQQKKELFAGRNKDRLLATKDRVESQNSQLEGALRSIRETEALAGEIGQELSRNRESIQRSKGRVGELSGMMKQADGHLKSMMRKWF